MLSAMTMGAMIHMQGDLLDRESIRQALRMVQSSSPSFPILASLDLARRQLQVEGAEAFSQALRALDTVLDKLAETPFRNLGAGKYRNKAVAYDPLKLVLFDETGMLDGFSLRDELGKRGCVAEMADSRYVVLAFGTGSIPEDGDALIQALFDIAGSFKITTVRASKVRSEEYRLSEEIPAPIVFRRKMPPSEAIPLEESAGRIAAEWVIPYPPGIPVLFPGEEIQPSAVNQLIQWRAKGAQIQGAEDSSLCRVRVLEK
ncbi:hypothetical protein D3H35_23920 [Cohnella faecalis]|uniref:Orn/Lys/Arg decarboxylase C-terminal domain-containing protein n=3 Tax=Cohnella faecalis TaxID=2315694 RepID=A0A398CJR4_9BACL|nr:hypothetical protein D3H35_23920 [Cohnella faecalis]